jgi:hypothetical protein
MQPSSPLLPATNAEPLPESGRRLGLRGDGRSAADQDVTGVLSPHDDPWSETLKRNFRPTSGDVNAFFAIILDNLANLTSMAGVLIFGFDMPARFVYVWPLFPAFLSKRTNSESKSDLRVCRPIHCLLSDRYANMVPGTTFGMMVGCIYLAVLALRLDRHYRRRGETVLVTGTQPTCFCPRRTLQLLLAL